MAGVFLDEVQENPPKAEQASFGTSFGRQIVKIGGSYNLIAASPSLFVGFDQFIKRVVCGRGQFPISVDLPVSIVPHRRHRFTQKSIDHPAVLNQDRVLQQSDQGQIRWRECGPSACVIYAFNLAEQYGSLKIEKLDQKFPLTTRGWNVKECGLAHRAIKPTAGVVERGCGIGEESSFLARTQEEA